MTRSKFSRLFSLIRALFLSYKNLLNIHIISGVLSANPTGNILLVGHSATLETCSHELVGKKPRLANEMTKVIQKIPYCSILQLDYKDNKWEITEPPCPPITHSNNPRFDWKILLN